MTHDPYQMHPTHGAYSGLTNPFSSPYTAMQTSGINPALAYNPLAANAGLYGGYAGSQGISPQQLQLAAMLAAQSSQAFGQSPFTNALQNPFINGGVQNPLTALQNPFIAAAIQRDLIQNQIAANQLAAVAQQNPQLAAQLAGNLGQIGLGQGGWGQIGLGQQFQQPGSGQAFQQPGLGQLGLGQQQQPGFGQTFQQPGLGQLGLGQQYQQPGLGQAFQQPGLSQLFQQHGFNQPYQQPFQQQPYQQMGQAGWGIGQQQVNPFSQLNNPFAQSTLAPQSWVGQGQQGQIHPLLLQAVARGIQPNQGITPWGTF